MFLGDWGRNLLGPMMSNSIQPAYTEPIPNLKQAR